MKKRLVRAAKSAAAAILTGALALSSMPMAVFGAELPFKDVKKEDWYYQFVEKTYESKVLMGVSADEFAPHINMTRAMFVQALANNASTFDKKNVRTAPMFTDVPSDAWFFDAVQWAADLHIISGVGDGKFNPAAQITRADMCVILNNYSSISTSPYKIPMGFTPADIKDNDSIPQYALDSVFWAYENKIAEGMDNGKFEPLGIVTRAQAATVLSKMDKVKDPDYDTYELKFGLKGADPIVSLELPKYWTDECLIEYTEDTAPGKGESEDYTVLARFYSKKNIDGDDEEGKAWGSIFSLILVKGTKLTSQQFGIGETIIDGEVYTVASTGPSDVRGTLDWDLYCRMRRDAGIAVRSAHMMGDDVEMSMKQKDYFEGTVLTMPMPHEWDGKYETEYKVDEKNGRPSVLVYEKENYTTSWDGLLFSLDLLPSKDANSSKLADIAIGGDEYTVYLNIPGNKHYDAEDAELTKLYKNLFNSMKVAVDNIWFGDEIIVLRTYTPDIPLFID